MINPVSNWDDIQESKEYTRLPAGGYICKILTAETGESPQKKTPFVRMTFDIVDGEYKGQFANVDADKAYTHQFDVYTSEKAMGIFKGFLVALDKSNKTTFGQLMKTVGVDEKKFVGKYIGLVIGYKEYTKSNGETGQKMYVKSYKSVEDIQQGKFIVPELVKAESKSAESNPFDSIDPSFIPF